MENTYSPQGDTPKDLVLSALSIEFLREATKWAKFLSILGFIGVAFMVIASFFMGALLSILPSTVGENTAMPVPPWIFSLIYLVFAVLYAFPIYYLYKFSVDTRKALDANNADFLAEGFRYLKSHYKFIGVMAIVMFVLYIIIIIGAIVVGIAAATLT